MTADQLDTLLRPCAQQLHDGHMRRLGIANTQRLAHACSQLKFGPQDAWRQELYRTRLADLLAENGSPTRPPVEMKDGFAIDTSMSLPYLDDVLEEGDRIVAERAGTRKPAPGTYRGFFRNLWDSEDVLRYPAFLNFATSSDVLAVVAHYLRCIPALSTTLPPGIRVVESSAAYDDEPERPKDSQLFHIDYYSMPNVYVLVLLRDTTPENGPWVFLPRSLSQKVAAALGYWGQGCPYRLSDEQVYSVVGRDQAIPLCYPRGTVLFIESSGCMHYGSRNAVKPRYQVFFGFTGACRTDFTELIQKPGWYPLGDKDSALRKMVLNKYMPAPGQPAALDERKLALLLEEWRRLAGPETLPPELARRPV